MHRPRLQKRFGQHHLVDGSLCRPLVEFLDPGGRRVVEIGPGGGVLTRELLAVGARVLGAEIDPAWAFALHAEGPGSGSLQLVVSDALNFPWHRVPTGTRVAGNLPYNVATAILARLLPHPDRIDRAAFLVQLEVADRLAAAPGQAAYGALSVLTQARAAVRRLGRVRPGSFRPPPKVESAFVGLTLAEPPLPEPEMAAFAATVHLAFASRRKTLVNSLATRWPKARARAAVERAGLPASARAEQLSLAELLALHRAAGELDHPAPAGG